MQELNSRQQARASEARYRAKLALDEERSNRRRANQRAWRAADPERRAKYDKARTASWMARKAWMIAFRAARRRATKFGMEFSLTHQWAEARYGEGSFLSGIPFQSGNGPFSPSIDRIDSAKGYTIENSRMLLRAENLFKNEWADEDVIVIAKAIAARNA